MLRFLTDEDLNGAIITALCRRIAGLDVVRVVDIGLSETDDALILEAAARDGRVTISHDASTMTVAAWARVGQGLPMAGLIIVTQNSLLQPVLDDLVAAILLGTERDFADKVIYLPYR